MSSKRHREPAPDDPAQLLDGPPEEPPARRGKKPGLRREESWAPNLNRVQPPDVSDRVWKVAQAWIERGTRVWDGKRPPVNLRDFSIRLRDKVHGDKTLRRLKIEDVAWCLDWMVKHFWDNLDEGTRNTSFQQFAFLDEEWDWWIERAVMNLAAATYLKPVEPREWREAEGQGFLRDVQSAVRWREIREEVLDTETVR